VFDDAVNQFAALAKDADGFVFGAPVYYGSAAGGMSAFMDRLFFSAGKILQYKPAASVVSCRRGGASEAFTRLNMYYTINQMPVVSSQYWNQVHGNSPAEVERDEEGLQTMRTLARNMAWLLKSIAAGKEKGIPMPEVEARISTNFIR
jgi:multimeric flavodoxin WrbA